MLTVDRQAGKLIVEGVNRVYKHVRRSQKNPQGGRLSKEMPIQISNVLLVCPQVRQGRRGPASRFLDDGSKERYCKKCGAGSGDRGPARGSPRQEEVDPSAATPRARRQARRAAPNLGENRTMTPATARKIRTGNPARAGREAGPTNRLSLPRLEKIVVNMGVGAAIQEKKYLEMAVDALTQITGQKPIITKSRKAIAGFRLREGMPIGCKVTLRRPRMYEFLDRLISLALPRVRDFRGLNPHGVRRPRQLQPGPDRTVGVPGVESGQVHPRPGHEYYAGDLHRQR